MHMYGCTCVCMCVHVSVRRASVCMCMPVCACVRVVGCDAGLVLWTQLGSFLVPRLGQQGTLPSEPQFLQVSGNGKRASDSQGSRDHLIGCVKSITKTISAPAFYHPVAKNMLLEPDRAGKPRALFPD